MFGSALCKGGSVTAHVATVVVIVHEATQDPRFWSGVGSTVLAMLCYDALKGLTGILRGLAARSGRCSGPPRLAASKRRPRRTRTGRR